jgi:long-chain acyl-CoA synthetase
MPEESRRSYFAFRKDYTTEKWSYRKVFLLAVKFSALLEASGIEKADRVVVWGANSLPMVVAYLGILNCGAVLVPLDQMFSPQMALGVIRRVQARLVVSARENKNWLDDVDFIDLQTLEEKLLLYPTTSYHPPEVSASDPAEIVFTSGITGEPKGVTIRHRNITALFPAIENAVSGLRWVFRLLGNVHFLALLPLSHLYGHMLEIFIPLMIKGSVVFPQKLSVSFLLETIKKENIHVAVCVPRILEILRLHVTNYFKQHGREDRFRRKFRRAAGWHFVLRYLYFWELHRRLNLEFVAIIVGGAKLDPDVYEFFRRLSFAVYQGYGLTETSPGNESRFFPGTLSAQLPASAFAGFPVRPLLYLKLEKLPDSTFISFSHNYSLISTLPFR